MGYGPFSNRRPNGSRQKIRAQARAAQPVDLSSMFAARPVKDLHPRALGI